MKNEKLNNVKDSADIELTVIVSENVQLEQQNLLAEAKQTAAGMTASERAPFLSAARKKGYINKGELVKFFEYLQVVAPEIYAVPKKQLPAAIDAYGNALKTVDAMEVELSKYYTYRFLREGIPQPKSTVTAVTGTAVTKIKIDNLADIF